MDYLQNHCWCSDSNWGVQYYCRHIVTLHSYDHYKEDWGNIIDVSADVILDKDSMERTAKYFTDGLGLKLHPSIEELFARTVPNLKPHVLEWLADNVDDRKDPDCEKGWCIGSLNYRSTDSKSSFSVFFHRRKDAMLFIKVFSKFKKPVHYCQYFTDTRKTLNLETLQYEH